MDEGLLMADVTILICYEAGTIDMLNSCLSAIDRHTSTPYKLLIVTKHPGEGRKELLTLDERFGIQESNIYLAPPQTPLLSGRVHGAMIDAAMGAVGTKYLLTLDSDCFPVADNWLKELVGMMEPDVACAGILHPWQPPAEDMDKTLMEYRVRANHCWNVTHVACQLVRKDFVVGHNLSYAGGDDTGLLIPRRALEIGMRVVGWMPTRCANPQNSEFDPEFNRHVCLMWGDRVYHHGEYTRRKDGRDKDFEQNFGWVLPLVLSYEGAEFLLDDNNSYSYKFDREPEAVANKMERLFGMRKNG